MGPCKDDTAKLEVDARDMAVAPGFINMLSWATGSLFEDGRALSDLHQGVTLEVIGEGWSYGPLNESLRRDMKAQQGDIKYDIPWTTLSDYLEYLRPGVVCRPTSRRLLEQPRCELMCWDMPTDRRTPRSLTKCEHLCDGQWRAARWGLDRR